VGDAEEAHVTMAAYLQFWGKARPVGLGGPQWHPVAYHLLDVAAAMEALLAARPPTRRRAARLLDQPEDAAAAWLVTMTAMHDLGKFARAFQAKCPDLWPPALGAFDATAAIPRSHTDDGALLWDEHLRAWLGSARWPICREVDMPIMAAVFGHHGRPLRLDWADWQRYFGPEGLRAASACTAGLVGLLGAPLAGELEPDTAKRASWWIAGLVSLADWVGSNQEWFPFCGGTIDTLLPLEEYWQRARRQAGPAIAAAGLHLAGSAPLRSFASLTGLTEPTPMQRWAESVALPEGPVLVIIEDVTGAGKTEAAQVLIHRLLVTGRSGGVYWGMPTQATANAMYLRQQKAIARLFEDGSTPTMVLAHGQARLHQAFQASAARTPDPELAASLETGDLSASASCTAFLRDDRRAGLLADVGAGTVDQALLAILPSKFNTVRLAGLADKVLVLDEVHAFDAYMGVEAQRLLAFQAALGGSAILLSATLPEAARRSLLASWEEGLRFGVPATRRRLGEPDEEEGALASSYPLATVVSAGTRTETSVPAAPGSRRTTPVRLVHSFESAATHLLDSARAGAAAAWIRNTVDDCLAAADWLRDQGGEVLVFHARFAQGDRQERESAVLERFGPRSLPEERRGRIVVATQVIEQSLDLDFDAMVTDLAPMDFIIQRAGRFHRHAGRNRPAGLEGALVIHTPALAEQVSDAWLAGPFKPTAHVYHDPGVLLKTAQLLAEHGCLRVPDDLRMLVEGAYAGAELPDGLRARADRAWAAAQSDAAMARLSALRIGDGYTGRFQGWLPDTQILTRLGEPQITVRLARLEGDRVVPWVANPEMWRAWALSEVKVSLKRLPPPVWAEPAFRRAIAAARQTMGEYEREIPVLVLQSAGAGRWAGVLTTGRGNRVEVLYSVEDGLVWGGGRKTD
jgi:CRISPR-associated endonuclease/helicase Cas3